MIFRRQKSVNPFSLIAAGGDLIWFTSYRIPLSGTTRTANLDTFYREPEQKCLIGKPVQSVMREPTLISVNSENTKQEVI